jgi:uncharacterized phiE125 gp8 family phage protein
MHRPALVTASTVLPVTKEEVKLALRIDEDDLDADIERLIRAAADHYGGWQGVLGLSLVEQTWRQDFDSFEQRLLLPVGPVSEIVSVKCRNAAGQLSTIAAGNYALKQDAGGRFFVRFVNAFSPPSDLYEEAAVSVEYKAGWPLGDGNVSTVPADIKTAIILFVQKHVDEAARESAETLTDVEHALISKYRLHTL